MRVEISKNNSSCYLYNYYFFFHSFLLGLLYVNKKKVYMYYFWEDGNTGLNSTPIRISTQQRFTITAI